MKRWRLSVWVLVLISWIAGAAEVTIVRTSQTMLWPIPPNQAFQSQKDDNSQHCSGMYSKSSWGGAVDPFILVTFLKQDEGDALVSMVIYEYRDKGYIGRPIGDDPYQVRGSLKNLRSAVI